jgi:hypothetical protein
MVTVRGARGAREARELEGVVPVAFEKNEVNYFKAGEEE